VPPQEIEALRAKQRRQGIMVGLPHSTAAAGTAAGATGLQQLPQHSPGLEQHPRLAHQQGTLPVIGGSSSSPARAAGAGRVRQQGEGIFALAHVPSTAAADAVGAAEEGGGAGASFEGWGGAGARGWAVVGADFAASCHCY
jgi:hypothetical protein